MSWLNLSANETNPAQRFVRCTTDRTGVEAWIRQEVLLPKNSDVYGGSKILSFNLRFDFEAYPPPLGILTKFRKVLLSSTLPTVTCISGVLVASILNQLYEYGRSEDHAHHKAAFIQLEQQSHSDSEELPRTIPTGSKFLYLSPFRLPTFPKTFDRLTGFEVMYQTKGTYVALVFQRSLFGLFYICAASVPIDNPQLTSMSSDVSPLARPCHFPNWSVRISTGEGVRVLPNLFTDIYPVGPRTTKDTFIRLLDEDYRYKSTLQMIRKWLTDLGRELSGPLPLQVRFVRSVVPLRLREERVKARGDQLWHCLSRFGA